MVDIICWAKWGRKNRKNVLQKTYMFNIIIYVERRLEHAFKFYSVEKLFQLFFSRSEPCYFFLIGWKHNYLFYYLLHLELFISKNTLAPTPQIWNGAPPPLTNIRSIFVLYLHLFVMWVCCFSRWVILIAGVTFPNLARSVENKDKMLTRCCFNIAPTSSTFGKY